LEYFLFYLFSYFILAFAILDAKIEKNIYLCSYKALSHQKK